MAPRPHLFGYLTQEEWKTCFAIAFLADTAAYGREIDLSDYHVRGQETTWESAIIAAVRFLALEHDFDFEAVGVREEDQEILAKQRNPIRPENALYLELLAVGKLPDIPLAMNVAIRLLHERAPSFNTEALEQCREDIQEQVRQVVTGTNIEELKKTEQVLDAALGSIGVVRAKLN